MSSVINTLIWEPILSKKDLEKIVPTNNGGVDVITFKVEIKGLKGSIIYSSHFTGTLVELHTVMEEDIGNPH